ncbi:hypothetical protein BOTBODRAFT_34526 [Botryobasidium botryosum FD-172 SS1]|uniref:Aldehyde dehydrogenase domain-containing protein n=1 Tax=Botryobasidium botryosum (strain FD-172 SS1) TaxID=930990 RepID=A0A067M8Z8_BOTB1|nr:hypothetical protein BOTBODRAFT_34526 [Botryobasidium botryosum FD-172 SS1]
MPPVFNYQFENQLGFRGQSTFSTGLFIDGKFVDAIDGQTIEVVNPAKGDVIGTASLANEKDIDAAVNAATRAFQTSWGLKVPASERARLLLKLADLIDRDADELASLETLNVGKPYLYARYGDVAASAMMARYYAGWADKLTGKTVEVDESKLIYTRQEPLGVVAGIIPWNFPLFLLVLKLTPALATGNTVILKPSELTPLTSIRLCSLINEAGFPPGVVNVVAGTGQSAGVAIANHMGIQKIALTGGPLAGRSLLKAAGNSNLKRLTLELGGKSPAIIFDDADFDDAVRWASFGIFFNAGQMCMAGSRIYVQETIYDKFIEAFLAHSKTLRTGDPFDPATQLGAQISSVHTERIMRHIKVAVEEGATLVAGGSRIDREGYFVEPTVFTNVKHDMKIIQEEIFGPVVAIAKFKDEEEVLKMANGTMYGLAASVFTNNVTRAIKISGALEAGTVWVNCHHNITPQVSYGGYKQSGMGRELGDEAIGQYTNTKAVHINLGSKSIF